MVGPDSAKWPSWRTNIVSKQLCKILPKMFTHKAWQQDHCSSSNQQCAKNSAAGIRVSFFGQFAVSVDISRGSNGLQHLPRFNSLNNVSPPNQWEGPHRPKYSASRLQFDISNLAWSILLPTLCTGVALLYSLCAKLLTCLQVFSSTLAWQGGCTWSVNVSHPGMSYKASFCHVSAPVSAREFTDKAHTGWNSTSCLKYRLLII